MCYKNRRNGYKLKFSGDCGDFFLLSSSLAGLSCIWKHIVVLIAFIFPLQNEDNMRKSFQQQLTDAIAVIKGMYQVGFWCCQGEG
jgi:hypothetical protein